MKLPIYLACNKYFLKASMFPSSTGGSGISDITWSKSVISSIEGHGDLTSHVLMALSSSRKRSSVLLLWNWQPRKPARLQGPAIQKIPQKVRKKQLDLSNCLGIWAFAAACQHSLLQRAQRNKKWTAAWETFSYFRSKRWRYIIVDLMGTQTTQ